MEILQYLSKEGILDIDGVRSEMKKNERAKTIGQHPYAISQIKDGRWRTYIHDSTKKYKRREITKTKREDLEDFLVDFYQSQDSSKVQRNITLEELYPKLLEYKRLHGVSESTIKRINADWKTYYQNTEIIKVPIIQFTKLELDEWAHGIIKKHDMNKKKYNNLSIIMRQCLDYLVAEETISKNLFKEVSIDKLAFRKDKKKSSESQVFTAAEIKKMFHHAWSDFDNKVKTYQLSPLAFMFQFYTGLRLGELCTIRYEDIENSDFIHIQRMYRDSTGEVVEHTKSDHGDRRVPLTDNAKKLILAAKDRQKELGVDSNGYIFSITDEPLGYDATKKLYKKYCLKADVPYRSSHKARKTMISTLIDNGVNINTVREIAGHSDDRTTLNCYTFDVNEKEVIKNKVEKALLY